MTTKAWREYTEKEVDEHKRKVCSRCVYFSTKLVGSDKTAIRSRSCDYIFITGKRRGCSPMECVERGIFREGDKKRRPKPLRIAHKSPEIWTKVR